MLRKQIIPLILVIAMLLNVFFNFSIVLAEDSSLSQPCNLSLISVTNSAILISWDEPEDKDNIVTYDLFIENELVKSCPVGSNFCTITGLETNKLYLITVKSKDQSGNYSSPSNELSVTINPMYDNEDSEWHSFNPGAGGQVQDIYCDPNIPGRLYFCSDMEGIYRSDDFGLSWHYISEDIIHGMSFVVEVEYGNSERVYAGTAYGLSMSNNNGNNWEIIDSADGEEHKLLGVPIATITVDKNNPNNVYAGPGWIIKAMGNLKGDANPSTDGARVIYYSKDRGETWHSTRYEEIDGNKQVYTITVDPQNSNCIYIGARAGLYKSCDGGLSWQKITAPTGSSGVCYGADITPDGQYIYATFQKVADKNPPNSVYVSKIDNINWKEINSGLEVLGNSKGQEFWKPVIDPRSTSANHEVLLGNSSGSSKLYEGSFTVDGSGDVSGNWECIFDAPYQDSVGLDFDFDYGWNKGNTVCRHYCYTPMNWPERKVWTMSQQAIYVGDPANPLTSWETRSSKKISTRAYKNNAGQVVNIETYQSRGHECTYNDDVVAYNNYMAQSMADNGILESWDYGKSWTEVTRPGGVSNGDVLEVVKTEPYPIILAGVAYGFGGATGTTGELWAKKIVNNDVNDLWVRIAGGNRNNATPQRSGVPQSRVYSVAIDPNDVNKVVIGTSSGVYATNNIVEVVDYYILNDPLNTKNSVNKIFFTDIGQGKLSNIRYLSFEPGNSDVIYVLCATGTWKGEKNDGNWNWTKINDISGGGTSFSDMSVWENEETIYIAVNDSSKVVLSIDGGQSWKTIITNSELVGFREHKWFNKNLYPPMTITLNSLIGYKNNIYLVAYVEDFKKGFAAIKGLIKNDGTFQWIDWTDGKPESEPIPYPRARRAKIYEINKDGKNAVYLFHATMGTGNWGRMIEGLDFITTETPNEPLIKGGKYSLTIESPTDDARVVMESTTPGTENTNYGTGSNFQLDAKNYVTESENKYRESYLKFNVTGINGVVTKAILRIYAWKFVDLPVERQDALPVDVTFYGNIPNTFIDRDGIEKPWTESNIVYNAKPVSSGQKITENPGISEEITSVEIVPTSGVMVNKWVDVDVTKFVQKDGIYSFAFAKKDSSIPEMIRFYGKEKGLVTNEDGTITDYRPKLIIEYGDDKAPTSPVNLFADNIKSKSVDIKWSKAYDNIAVTAYDIYNNLIIAGTVSGDVNNYIIRNLSPNFYYSVTVKAKDAVGNESAATSQLIFKTMPEDTLAPTAPQNIIAEMVKPTKITLKWDKSIDDNEVISYNIYKNNQLILTVSGDVNKCIITELTPATEYSFKIRAVDESGNLSPESQEIIITTAPADIEKPTPPEGIEVIYSTETEAKIVWEASIDNYDVDHYEIFHEDELLSITTQNECILTNLKSGRKYILTLIAVDEAGNKSDGVNIILYTKVGLSNFIANTYTYYTMDPETNEITMRTMPYRLFIPENYDPKIKYPLVVFLHGGGESGTDNAMQVSLSTNAGARLWAEPYNQEKQPAFVLAPQTNFSWASGGTDDEVGYGNQGVMQLIYVLESQYNIDSTRRYITGTSMGGAGIYDIITKNPKIFAAAIPIAASGDKSKASNANDIYIWAFHGTVDLSIPYNEGYEMYEAIINSTGYTGKAKFTTLKNIDHGGSWAVVYQDPQLSNEVLEWLYSKKLEEDITPPSVPHKLNVSSFLSRGTLLSWDASYDNGSGILVYEIYRNDNVKGISSAKKYYDDNGGLYDVYKIKAVNGAMIKSDYSTSVSIEVPEEETNLPHPALPEGEETKPKETEPIPKEEEIPETETIPPEETGEKVVLPEGILLMIPSAKELIEIIEPEEALEKAKEIIKNSQQLVNNAFEGKESINEVTVALTEIAKTTLLKVSSVKILAKADENKNARASLSEENMEQIISKAEQVVSYSKELTKEIENLGIDKQIVPATNIKVITDEETKSLELELEHNFIDKIKKRGIEALDIEMKDVILTIPLENVLSSENVKILVKKLDEKDLKENTKKLINANIKKLYEISIISNASQKEEPVKNNEVRIKYLPGKNENINHLNVVKINDNEEIENMVGIYDSLTDYIKFQTKNFSKFAIVLNVIEFKDIDNVIWAKEQIESLAAKGIVKGRPNGLFAPYDRITRAEFAALLVRMFNLKEGEPQNKFKDVDNNAWYASEVAWAYKAGLIEGIGGDMFNPDGYITRQDMAVMVSRALKTIKGKKLSEGTINYLEKFNDKDEIAEYAKGGVALAVKYGIIKGISLTSNKFAPLAEASRAEAAVMLFRLLVVE